VKLPLAVVLMVKRYSVHSRVSLETAWHSMIMMLALQCARKSAAAFWIQASNRDSENSHVFGYVTTEVGVVAEVDADAPFEQRWAQCLQALAAITTEHRNVFPEIAATHPTYGTFLEASLGINLLGNAPDRTDRSVVRRALEASRTAAASQQTAGLSGQRTLAWQHAWHACTKNISAQMQHCHEGNGSGSADAFFGCMNWIEIGDEVNDVVRIRGRDDVVQFCVDMLMPALSQLANGAAENGAAE